MCVQSPLMFKVEILPYTPYDGPSVANQNSQKYLTRSWRATTPIFSKLIRY